MKKFFVIGSPIKHSLSPNLHNYWLKKNNIKANYDKKELVETELKEFINEIKIGRISGVNVTVPYKHKVIPYLDQLSPDAQKTGSVNTIYLNNGLLIGDNTDIKGFELSIKNINFEAKNKKILILGAGGVVPSIIFALKRMQVSRITISNRTKKKAENLKSLFEDLEIIDWGQSCDFDMIINATSLGLKKNDKINLNFLESKKEKLFYDVIYNPSETSFLKAAKMLGNMTENGKMMFIYQACEAFKIWHKMIPKIDDKTFEIFAND